MQTRIKKGENSSLSPDKEDLAQKEKNIRREIEKMFSRRREKKPDPQEFYNSTKFKEALEYSVKEAKQNKNTYFLKRLFSIVKYINLSNDFLSHLKNNHSITKKQLTEKCRSKRLSTEQKLKKERKLRVIKIKTSCDLMDTKLRLPGSYGSEKRR